MSTDLRARWAAIPGVTYAPANAAPASPPRNKRKPGAPRHANHRPKCYLEHPELYTSRGRRRRYPFGVPTEPGWITSAQACAILHRSPGTLSRLARLHALDTCTYVNPTAKNGARRYYREEQIRALLHRPDRRQYNPGSHKSSQH